MSQSLARILIHLVFSTKNRKPLLAPTLRPRVFEYLGGLLNGLHCPVVQVGGVADHVHVLFALSRGMSISEVVEESKKQSSKWAKENVDPEFYWQNGYGAFSVSVSNSERVKRYIQNQEHHHKIRTFQDELRELLRRHEIEWDERYVWD